MREIASQGITDYLVEPIGGGAYHNVVSIATKEPGGFTDEHVAAMQRLFKLFAIHVERHTPYESPSTYLTHNSALRRADKFSTAQFSMAPAKPSIPSSRFPTCATSPFSPTA